MNIGEDHILDDSTLEETYRISEIPEEEEEEEDPNYPENPDS